MTNKKDERGRFVLVFIPSQKDDTGYIPSICYENDFGHIPMYGNQEKGLPTVHAGSTPEEAKRNIRKWNHKKLKLNDEEIRDIVMSNIEKSKEAGFIDWVDEFYKGESLND